MYGATDRSPLIMNTTRQALVKMLPTYAVAVAKAENSFYLIEGYTFFNSLHVPVEVLTRSVKKMTTKTLSCIKIIQPH